MSAFTQINQNTTADPPSTADLHDLAYRALLGAIRDAAKRYDHHAAANFSEALRVLGGS